MSLYSDDIILLMFTDLPKVEDILQESGKNAKLYFRYILVAYSKNLRGHKNKKQYAAAVEGEYDSTRSKFPARFELYTLGSLAKTPKVRKNQNLKMF